MSPNNNNNNNNNNNDDDDEGGGSEDKISSEAIKLAEEVAAIAGLPDPAAWPPTWCGAAMRVDVFLREGYIAEDFRLGAKMVMARKHDGPPQSIEYFKWGWAKARGIRESPVPAPPASARPRRNIRDEMRERFDDALTQLRAFANGTVSPSDEPPGSGEAGGASHRQISYAVSNRS
jgi:hypothetical protein